MYQRPHPPALCPVCPLDSFPRAMQATNSTSPYGNHCLVGTRDIHSHPPPGRWPGPSWDLAEPPRAVLDPPRADLVLSAGKLRRAGGWHIVSSLYRLCCRNRVPAGRRGHHADRAGLFTGPPRGLYHGASRQRSARTPKWVRAGQAGGVGRVGMAGAVHTNSGAGPQYCQGWGL